jgi:hypothetical protein
MPAFGSINKEKQAAPVLAFDRAEHFSIGEWGQCLLKLFSLFY